MSRAYGIAESTLKCNTRILKKLGIISYGNGSARLTDFGTFILKIMEDDANV